MGHNFGLLHAAYLDCGTAPIGGTCSVSEYGDRFDIMGNVRAMHFNAMQKSNLAWIPTTSVKTHTSGSATYDLTPIETGGGSSYAVKVPTTNANRTYWIEYRQPVGFDSPLAGYPNNGAQIRVASPFETMCGGCDSWSDDTQLLDMTPATATFDDATLVVGQSFTDATNGVTINVLGSTSTQLTVQVVKAGGAATATTLASTPNPSTQGTTVTFTATVTGTAPTGTVTFTDAGAAISGCSAVALAGSGNSRTAQCATSAITVATHSIVATYSGDAGNAGSTSAALSQVVNSKPATTTGLGSSLNPSTFGTSVTFTAIVTGNAPTGTVAFTDGGAAISGCGAVALAGSGNSRTAQCATAALTAATHIIAAAYSGDAGNAGSASATLSQVVNKVATTTALASSQNPSTVGATVTFTATITGNAPTGTVSFTDGGAAINGCSAVALAGTGNTRTAQCAIATLSAATHSIVAAYAGDARNANSTSAALAQGVGKPATATTLGSSLNPSTLGAGVSFTATITGNAPTGAVAFTDGGVAISGCSAVALAGSGNSRTAQCATSTLSVATHSIVATYAGDAANAGSTSAALSQVVSSKPATTTALGSSRNPSTFGTSVAFTATVTGTAPTGTVAFTDGGATISGCSAVALAGSGNSRTAQCAGSALSVATHSIVATYSGDAGNAGSSSAALSQQVVAAAVSSVNVALASNGGAASASSSYSAGFPASSLNDNNRAGTNWGSGGGWNDATFGAYPDWAQILFNGTKTIDKIIVYTLQDNYASPTEPTDTQTFSLYGSIDFTVQSWNGTSWVTLATVAGNNLVKRTVTFPATATDRIRVNVTRTTDGWSRITEIEAWTSSGAALPTTTATLTSSLNPSASGSSVTFTATIAGNAPTGTVAFTDGGTALTGCGSVALSGSGNSRTAQCATASLGAGTHNIVAAYGGDSGNTGSASTPLSQFVNATGGAVNVALASNGGVASVSSTYSSGYPASSLNNNNRAGTGWGSGGGWNDGTYGAYPDTAEIDFSGSKTIDRVVVYTLQDNFANPGEPSDTQTFSLYGVTGFTVQARVGSKWTTLATVTGNNLVKRTVTFAPTTTSRIRVRVNGSVDGYSRLTEIEAWGH